MDSSHCHVCQAPDLDLIPRFSELPGVTSDCRPWPNGADLGICTNCGTVQKVATARWHEAVGSIYTNYSLYHQSDIRAEDQSFDPASGMGQARSKQLLQVLAPQIDFTRRGWALDFGAGIGVTLRAFHKLAPDWRLDAYEPNLKDEERLSKLAGVSAVHSGPLEDLQGQYDCVLCMHVLEHVIDPVRVLARVGGLLNDGGRLIIQVPYFRDNAFDLMIDIVTGSTSIVEREITIVASRRRSPDNATGHIEPNSDRAFVLNAGSWLRHLIDQNRALADRADQFGIFGTSIAATFIANALDGGVAFFVDEHPARIGSRHMGRPIYSPEATPNGAVVSLVLMPSTAARIGRRLERQRMTLHYPPPLDMVVC